MDLLNEMQSTIMHIGDVFSESPVACFLLVCIFGIATICCIVGLVNGLFVMHRSRTKIKNTRRKYSFLQRVALLPDWYECLHAKHFCRFLIVVYHLRCIFMLLSVILTVLINAIPVLGDISASFSAFVFIVVDIPVLIFHLIMDRYPFQRLRHEYRFKKYHNTQNHDSLF